MRIQQLLITVVATSCLVFSPQVSLSQAPTYGSRSASDGAVPGGKRAVAANNPWFRVGAQFGYKFAGNSDFAEGLIASSRIVLQKYSFPNQTPRLGLPVIGNLSRLTASTPPDSFGGIISRVIDTAEGMNIGLYPYYEMFDRSKNGAVQATVYGSTVYKLNAGKSRTDSSAVSLNSGRMSLGLGLDLFIAERRDLPVSLSVEYVTTFLDRKAFERVTGSSVSRIYSIELTGIMPIGNTLGLMGQFADPDHGNRLFRVGLIYAPAPKSTTTNTTNSAVGGPGAPEPNPEGTTTTSGAATTQTAVPKAEVRVVVLDAVGDEVKDATVTAQLFKGATLDQQLHCQTGTPISSAATLTSAEGEYSNEAVALTDAHSRDNACLRIIAKRGNKTVQLDEIVRIVKGEAADDVPVIRATTVRLPAS